MIVFGIGVTIFEVAEARAGDKRKREKPGDPGDIEGYKGEVSEKHKCNLYISVSGTIYLEKTLCSPIMSQTGGLFAWVR